MTSKDQEKKVVTVGHCFYFWLNAFLINYQNFINLRKPYMSLWRLGLIVHCGGLRISYDSQFIIVGFSEHDKGYIVFKCHNTLTLARLVLHDTAFVTLQWGCISTKGASTCCLIISLQEPRKDKCTSEQDRSIHFLLEEGAGWLFTWLQSATTPLAVAKSTFHL